MNNVNVVLYWFLIVWKRVNLTLHSEMWQAHTLNYAYAQVRLFQILLQLVLWVSIWGSTFCLVTHITLYA